VELVVVMAMLAVLLGIALPASRAWLDRVAVRGASDEVLALFAGARGHAISRGGAAVVLDSANGRVLLRVRRDTVSVRELRARLGVRVSTSRAEMAYDGRGLGRGAANLRVVLSRGAQAETIFVSRLGRARR
jgi:type II secretory pathway pseudopilin PulG